MAGASHVHRMRLALLRSTKEAGEAFSRVLRTEETGKLAPAAVCTPESQGSREEGGEGKITAKVCPVAATASVQTAGTSIHSSSKGKDGGPHLQDASFVRASLASSDLVACGGSFEGQGGSRLEESDGWYITDLIGGKDENDLFVASEEGSRLGSMVMVSSVDSLASMDKEEEELLPSKGNEISRQYQQEIAVPLLALEPKAQSSEAERSASLSSVVESIQEHFTKERTTTLFPELQETSALCIGNATPELQGERFYMINAGNGWNSFPSLQLLLNFLKDTVKVFGTDNLRYTRYMLPLEESDTFLNELEAVAPYTMQDVVNAVKAAATPLSFAVAARFCFVQLTEMVVGWSVAAEGTAAAAAVAGEAAAAAGTTATLSGVCSTFVAVTPWLLLAGGCVYAVVRGINELQHVRGKVIVCNTTEREDAETGEAVPWGRIEHCIIKWR